MNIDEKRKSAEWERARDFFKKMEERTGKIPKGTLEESKEDPMEYPIRQWGAYGFACYEKPVKNHEQLQITITGNIKENASGCVEFRGKRQDCIDLLKLAMQAMTGQGEFEVD